MEVLVEAREVRVGGRNGKVSGVIEVRGAPSAIWGWTRTFYERELSGAGRDPLRARVGRRGNGTAWLWDRHAAGAEAVAAVAPFVGVRMAVTCPAATRAVEVACQFAELCGTGANAAGRWDFSVARLIHLGHTKPCRAAWFVQGGTQRIERGWRCRRRRGHPGAGIWSGRHHSSHALCRRTLELRWEEKGVAPKPIH